MRHRCTLKPLQCGADALLHMRTYTMQRVSVAYDDPYSNIREAEEVLQVLQ